MPYAFTKQFENITITKSCKQYLTGRETVSYTAYKPKGQYTGWVVIRLDIEETIVHDSDQWWVQALFGALRPYYAVVSMPYMENYLLCSALIQGLHSLGHAQNPKLYVAMGGLRDMPQRIMQLYRQDRSRIFLIGGNEEEHRFYLSRLEEYGFSDFIGLPIARGSRDECESAISMARSLSERSLGVVTHEAHIVRCTLTMVKAAMDAGVHIPIVPVSFFDSSRYGLTKSIMAVGTMREAVKLSKWQKKGHVATFEEAMEYYRPWLDMNHHSHGP